MLNNNIQIMYSLSMAIIAINLHFLCLPTLVIVFCYICSKRFNERILLLFEKSSNIMTIIIPPDLADCTVGSVTQIQCRCLATASLEAICCKADADLDYVAISKTAIQRERYKKIESFGGQLRSNVITIKGKRLCLHLASKTDGSRFEHNILSRELLSV
jgi:hypothetical protein